MHFIERSIFPAIKKHLQSKEITLLLGPRQVGKTTILKKLQQELDQAGEPTIYWNLDNLEDRRYFTTQPELVQKLRLTFGDKPATVFIDEIQRLTNAGLFLKGLYDMDLPYKFVVTGSGSLELKANVIESMVGRKKVFLIYPLTFTEFIQYKTGTTPDQWDAFFMSDPLAGQRLLNEYSIFGGYPRVVLAETIDEKIAQLAEIYSSYIDKDIRALLDVEKDVAYQQLVRYLAGTVGSLMNRAEIARTIGLHEKTVSVYLDYLEKTFMVQLVRPFFKNITKEITKSPKVYFIDLGIRNYALQSFQDLMQRTDKGELFENFIFTRLLEFRPAFPIKFWRTKSGSEVDFIIEDKGRIIPIEVKSTSASRVRIPSGVASFVRQHHTTQAYFYTTNTEIAHQSSAPVTQLSYYQLPPSAG